MTGKPTYEDLERRIKELEEETIRARQVEEALRTSEKRYRALVDNASDIVFRADATGHFTFTNPAALHITGYEAQELLGSHYLTIIREDMRKEAVRFFGLQFVKRIPNTYCEYPIVAKDGREIWLGQNTQLIVEGDRVTGFQSVSRDITERKRIEEALRRSEANYRHLFDNSPTAIYQVDFKTGKFVKANDAMCEYLGCRPEEITSLGPFDVLTEESKLVFLERLDKMTRGEKVSENPEFEVIDRSGKHRWVQLNSKRFYDSEGLAGADVVAHEITDRKRVEKELRDSEEKYRLLIENANEAIYVQQEGRFRYANKNCSEMLGVPVAELMGLSMLEFLSPDDREKATNQHLRILRGELTSSRSDFRIRTRQGEERWADVNSVAITWDGSPATLHFATDITERKRAEETLRMQEMQLRTILESTGDGILAVDGSGRVIKANRKFADLWKITPDMLEQGNDEALLKHVLVQLVDPEAFLAKVRSLYQSSREEYETLLFKDGRVLERYSCPLLNEGVITGRVWSFRDVTERIRAEELLRRSEEKFRFLAENMNDNIFTIDMNLRTTYVSPSIRKLLGFTPEERMRQSITEQVTPDSLTRIGEILFRELERERLGLADRDRSVKFEVEYYHKNGSTVWMENVISAIRDDRGGLIGLHGVSRDITERKRAEVEKRGLEERLKRGEKMEALGALAGGVAHDLNNVLGVVIGYAELLTLKIRENDPVRGYADKILKSTEKAASIIQDLLTLARRGVVSADVIDLNSIVSGFLKTPVFEKMKDHHPHVHFTTACDPLPLTIKGSSVHLEKTVMNLVSNAAEAISGTGVVSIRTESRYLDYPVRGYDEVKEGEYAVLTVSDTGKGIPAEDREKIFEPFYTKKKMGRSGTGLGLSIVWGTVKDHNGYIDLQTEVGSGTTFALYFPLTREALTAEQQQMAVERYRGRGESVLVVDDIAEQREMAATILHGLGYQVHLASSGEEAVDYLKRCPSDILVLDMIMPPGIDGLETYRQALEINPKQKAILVSGFSETERVRRALEIGAGNYVKKPYLAERIGIAIRDELDRK